MELAERQQVLEKIHDEVRRCTACPLPKERTQAVPGAGPVTAEIMFIGEAPGFYEDQQGLPFVGRAGKLLDQMLEKAGIARERIYITNVIKCRPPGNRDPKPEEVEACRPFLERQLVIIDPKVIVTLGRYSMARAFPNEKISRIHGQPRRIEGRIYFPMYHPAAALHQPSLRRVVEEDFLKLRAVLEGRINVPDYDAPPDAEQLSLF